ncbi:hypothetical protein HPB49_018068 [Dermacentor silvarum]|uniref:Uncharacterized protein n=1 Tax=Dermacentor silvarum TaxID=543639 RepID=A0ACB8CS62_DERSI|nr:hypothetical protein HPB49_018068 [Dermacentor silvarum]
MAAHVDVKRVVESIKALRTIERKHQTKKSVKNILDEDTALEHDVYLQFTLKKIPYNKSTQWIKMLPRRIDLASKHLRRDIEAVLSSTELPLRGEGTTSTVKVCNLAMSDTDAAENVMAACETLGCRLPGGWPNVLSLHIKTQKSPGLPLYMSFGSRNDIRLPKPRQPDDDVEGDLTTIPGARVTVKRTGQVTLRKGAKDLTDETLGDKRLRRLLEIQEQGAEEATRQFELKAKCRKLLIQSTLRNKKSRNNRLKASKHPAPQKKTTKTKKQVARPRKKAAKQK